MNRISVETESKRSNGKKAAGNGAASVVKANDKKTRKKNKRKPRVIGEGTVDDTIVANAIAFVNARRNPWAAGDNIVFPDPDPFPVTPSHLRGRFTPPVQSFAVSTGKFWGFRISPDILSFITYANIAANGPSDITCNGGIAVNSTAYTTLLADMGLYRTVAVGIRLHGIGQLLEAGGEVVVSRLPPGTPTTFDLDDALASVATDVCSEVQLLEKPGGVPVRWIGISSQSVLYDTAFRLTASAFRAPNTGSQDSEIWVVGFTGDNAGSIDVEVEYDLLINSVPLTSANQVYDVIAVPSSGDALAKAELAGEMQDSHDVSITKEGSGMIGVGSFVKEGLLGLGKKGLGLLAKELGPFGQVAEDLGGKALDWFGGLFQLPPEHWRRAHGAHPASEWLDELHSRFATWEIVVQCHRMAVYSGLSVLSPLVTCPPPEIDTVPKFLRYLAEYSTSVVPECHSRRRRGFRFKDGGDGDGESCDSRPVIVPALSKDKPRSGHLTSAPK